MSVGNAEYQTWIETCPEHRVSKTVQYRRYLKWDYVASDRSLWQYGKINTKT